MSALTALHPPAPTGWLVPADSSSVAPSWSFSHTGIENKAVIAMGLVYSTLVSKCVFFFLFFSFDFVVVCLLGSY